METEEILYSTIFNPRFGVRVAVVVMPIGKFWFCQTMDVIFEQLGRTRADMDIHTQTKVHGGKRNQERTKKPWI